MEKGCTCDVCKKMCLRPCWPAPDEVLKLIEAGYGPQLMLDYWVVESGDIYLVCPASAGYEGKMAPHRPPHCTFNHNFLCDLHDLDLKPLEGRMADCKRSQPDLHKKMADLWDSVEGQTVVKVWKEKFYVNQDD